MTLSLIRRCEVMARAFNVGDDVSWNSEAGRVTGRIVRVHTSTTRPHRQRGDPHEIKSDRTALTLRTCQRKFGTV